MHVWAMGFRGASRALQPLPMGCLVTHEMSVGHAVGRVPSRDALRREAGSVRGALERAYTTRFQHRHGLDPTQVEALLGAVRPLKVYQVMAQDIHVPRPRAD